MYHRYYSLHSAPFENTADPRFFFASEQHREALAAIEYTIRMRKGVVLITGEIGAGKTTVGRVMCQNCADTASIMQITPRYNTGIDLLRQVLRSAEIPVHAHDDYATMLHNFQVFLSNRVQHHKPVVLFVDEAQSLSDDAMEELRVLSNLDTAKQRLIQVVLIGQPELRHRVRQPGYEALRQRIVLAKQLGPMNAQETADYVLHRLRSASVSPDQVEAVFSPQTLQAIYRATGGVPRLINVVCDNCLLLGLVRETRDITPEMVQHVMQDMVPRFDNQVSIHTEPLTTLSLAGNL